MQQPALAAGADIALVVDMDGTLIKVDSLHESFLQLLAMQPLRAVAAPAKIADGRAAFKTAVADYVLPDPHTAPFNEAVLDAIREARRQGRKVYLATASDRRVAEAIADHAGGFDGVFASSQHVNLSGQTKADCLVKAFGRYGFDYVGNAAADIPVWRAARTALVVGASAGLMRRLHRELPDVVELSRRQKSIKPFFKSLRPHQWLKNLLVFVPALAAHDFSLDTLLTLVAAFVSFSLGASSIYVVNDMLDIPHDRAHAEKRRRPLAAGTVTIVQAVMLAGVTITLSLAVATALPWAFLLVLGIYLALSLSYSLCLKRKLMVDVVALSALYGIRVVAGGASVGIHLTDWLVGFCFFIFLSLALMKRTTELMSLPEDGPGKVKGRGYRRADLPVLHALTAASGSVAVVILALYIHSPEVKLLYARPDVLWGICMILVYWLGRAFFLTGRCEMRQDPVVFAATDRISLLSGAALLAVFALAM
jgi:4-hydroxybenzoate polyprenyltransferase/phosphoserine phosphatase